MGTQLNFLIKLKKINLRNSIFCRQYCLKYHFQFLLNYLKNSISVVTCNKIACADEFSNYKNLKYLSKLYAPFH